ncbi:MAG TPA: nuclear transport factor 2 family protein [Steroidobacteraceae bacterium]
MRAQAQAEVSALLRTYFEGLYYGDAERLRSVFHPRALLFGEVGGTRYRSSVEDFLDAISSRHSPHARGEEFRMAALEVQLMNRVAYVRAHCPTLGSNCLDYLALMHDGERWLITNKLFTALES